MVDYLNQLPSYLVAIILLVVALIVAHLAKTLVKKLLKRIEIKKISSTKLLSNESIDFIGKFVYLFGLLLFLPEIFSQFGLSTISAPINQMLNKILEYIPNCVGFIIIFFIGLMVAKIIKELVEFSLKNLKVDIVQEKIGIKITQDNALSEVLSKIIYVLIVSTTTISALTILNIPAISQPAINMLNSVFVYLPKLLVAVIIVLLSIFISKLVSGVLKSVILSSGIDEEFNKLMPKNQKFILSSFISTFVRIIIILLLCVEALNVLDLDILKSFGVMVIEYLPLGITGILIAVGAYVSSLIFTHKLQEKNINSSLIVGVKTLIIAIGIFMALSQLQIATSIVNTTYILVVGAFSIAFAVSVGIGAKDVVAEQLRKLINNKE